MGVRLFRVIRFPFLFCRCRYCFKKFSRHGPKLRLHELSHYDQDRNQCAQCKRSFPTKFLLHKHFRDSDHTSGPVTSQHDVTSEDDLTSEDEDVASQNNVTSQNDVASEDDLTSDEEDVTSVTSQNDATSRRITRSVTLALQNKQTKPQRQNPMAGCPDDETSPNQVTPLTLEGQHTEEQGNRFGVQPRKKTTLTEQDAPMSDSTSSNGNGFIEHNYSKVKTEESSCRFSCGHCDKVFKTDYTYCRHMISFHPGPPRGKDSPHV